MEKYIKIETKTDDEGNELYNFMSKGLNEFEIIGMLTFYRDKIEVAAMKRRTDKPAKPAKD